MEYYVGLDVSLKEISICVVDRDGKTVARGVCPADPGGVAGWFRNRALLHKSPECQSSPFPGRTYPLASVTGVPSAVKPFRTATRTWNSAT